MASINNIEFDKIKLSVLNTDNKLKCYINYLLRKDNKLVVTFPLSTVAFDVDFTYTRPNLSIYLTDTGLIKFIDDLKHTIVSAVFKESKKIYGTQKTMEALNELYCNPHKFAPVRKFYTDLLQLKISATHLGSLKVLKKKTKVYLTVYISGIWVSEKSFGPYLNVIGLEYPSTVNDFVDDSDSEIPYLNSGDNL